MYNSFEVSSLHIHCDPIWCSFVPQLWTVQLHLFLVQHCPCSGCTVQSTNKIMHNWCWLIPIDLLEIKWRFALPVKLWLAGKGRWRYARCYPNFREFKQRGPNQLSYVLPPLDVASSMLCESVCQQLSSWEEVLLSSVRFVRLCFSDPVILFYNWYDGF